MARPSLPTPKTIAKPFPSITPSDVYFLPTALSSPATLLPMLIKPLIESRSPFPAVPSSSQEPYFQHQQSAFPFPGGETSALERLDKYIAAEDGSAATTYFDTRNGLLGTEFSTKFSPWLACGSLSARTILERCEALEDKLIEGNKLSAPRRKSIYWIQSVVMRSGPRTIMAYN